MGNEKLKVLKAETQTQGEINNQEDIQSTNESEIIIDIPTPYVPTRIENQYFN